MSRIFRQTWTAPIPEGAERVTLKGVPSVRFRRKGKPAVAPLTAKRDRILLESKKWYGEYRDEHGEVKVVPLAGDRGAAEMMLAGLIRKAEMAKAGCKDPHEGHKARPLAEHLADWEASLLASGATAKHVAQTVACARRLFEACGFASTADLAAEPVEQFLAGLRQQGRAVPELPAGQEFFRKAELAALLGVTPGAIPPLVRQHRLAAVGNGKARRYPRETAEALRAIRTRGRSAKTSNLYLDAARSFCGWMVERGRLASNPLAELSGANVNLDRRHDRQTLSADQLAALLSAARDSEKSFRGLSGRDRHALYLCALGTGFRASEAASLCPESFDLGASPPTAELPAAATKNRQGALQPLPPDVADVLRTYLAGRPEGLPVWPGTWHEKAAEMLRIDLEAAGVPYVAEGRDGPLYADFHSLRHSYIALLDKAGATLKEAMALARHSDPKLTMKVYGRAQLHDLGARVESLPLPPQGPARLPLRATGTDQLPSEVPKNLSFPCGTVASVGHQNRPEPTEGGEGGSAVVSLEVRETAALATESDSDRLKTIAPREGFEPSTNRLTAGFCTSPSGEEKGSSVLATVRTCDFLVQTQDVDLMRVAAAWPSLSPPLRAAIIALIGTTTNED